MVLFNTVESHYASFAYLRMSYDIISNQEETEAVRLTAVSMTLIFNFFVILFAPGVNIEESEGMRTLESIDTRPIVVQRQVIESKFCFPSCGEVLLIGERVAGRTMYSPSWLRSFQSQ